jgi:DNA-binding MarR family transcriptional regulator
MGDQLSPSAVEASQRVRAVIRRLRRGIAGASDPGDITLSQATVLTRLADSDGLTTSDLAAAEGVRHQSMTSTVTALLDLGLVKRRPDTRDGRRLLVTVTAKGRRHVERGRQARGEWLAGRLQEECTEQERQTVLAAMAVLDRLVHD